MKFFKSNTNLVCHVIDVDVDVGNEMKINGISIQSHLIYGLLIFWATYVKIVVFYLRITTAKLSYPSHFIHLVVPAFSIRWRFHAEERKSECIIQCFVRLNIENTVAVNSKKNCDNLIT